MPNTLGLDDDLDGVEVVRDLERIFGVKLWNDEAERISTVGNFHELLLRKIPPNAADQKCASAMTFYRLRRALGQLGYGQNLTPASDIRILERGRTKTNFKKLEMESGLDLPNPVTTNFGWSAFLLCFFSVWGGALYLSPGILSVFLGCLFALFGAGAVLNYIDPGKLPADCATLADLTKRTAALNFGRLVKMGARHGENEIWETLVEALSGYDLPKSDITRDTYFLKSQLKKAAAA
jgi:hypothetical protein